MTRRYWLLMMLLAALWGASYLFIKVALEDGVDPVFIVFARQVAVLVPPAAIFTVLLAVRYGDEQRPRGIAAAGVVMGIAGVVLLFGLDLSGDVAALAGGLMVLAASLGYAVGALYLKHRLQAMPAVGIAAWTLVVGAATLAPAALFTLLSRVPSLEAVGSLLVLGAGGTGVAFAIFYTLIADIGPGRASLVAYIAPGFAVAYGVTLLGEELTAAAILGLVLILVGSWIAAEGRLPGRAVTALEPPAREAA